MSYSKKILKDAKKKLRNENPSLFKKKTVIKNHDAVKKKKIVKWNYKVNDLVRCTRTKKIGLIVSDNTYFGEKVEKNYYFVLFDCAVKKYDGAYLRVI
tara:strand:+ start:733 stop:1026 length:294 start_codon:yes stop_codon:yes gene_type:complete